MKEYIPQNPMFSDEFSLVERADNVNAQIHNASVKQAMDNTVALKNQLDSYMGSMKDGKPQFADGIESGDVVGAINEVFTLGSEKKAQLVANLTAMGMQASTSDTWEVILEKILDMTDTSGDTVTAPVLLTGYTAHDASGEQISGNMPEMATVTVEAVSTTQDSEYTYLGMPEGHYDATSKVRTKNSNILIDIYSALVSVGVTPDSSSITDIIIAIERLGEQSANANSIAVSISGGVNVNGCGMSWSGSSVNVTVNGYAGSVSAGLSGGKTSSDNYGNYWFGFNGSGTLHRS